jgi:hypothetical protein
LLLFRTICDFFLRLQGFGVTKETERNERKKSKNEEKFTRVWTLNRDRKWPRQGLEQHFPMRFWMPTTDAVDVMRIPFQKDPA